MKSSTIATFAAIMRCEASPLSTRPAAARSKAACCALALMLAGLAVPSASAADISSEPGTARRYSPARLEQFTYNWVSMPLLPRTYQNHCGFYHGHYVCADHCGIDYQVYFCARSDVGCCQVGHGYCDGGGRLRCSPSLF